MEMPEAVQANAVINVPILRNFAVNSDFRR